MHSSISSGIYKISNTLNSQFYIGSSVNIEQRYKYHLTRLKHNKHPNIHLQRAVNKYGIENFKFEIIQKCPKEYTVKLEQWFLDNLNPTYNICKVASGPLEYRCNEEQRVKIQLKESTKVGRRKVALEKLRNTTVSQEKRLLIIKLLEEGVPYTQIRIEAKTSWDVIEWIKEEYKVTSYRDYYIIEKDDGLLFFTEADACKSINVTKGTINKCIKKGYKCKKHRWFKVKKLKDENTDN